MTLNISSNFIEISNDETSFTDKLLLTDTQVSKNHKAFADGSSANIKFSKTHLSKMTKLGGLVGNFLVTFSFLNKWLKK